MSEPVVSIICTAYNHGPYIRRTLEGFLMQKTDFPFEILVHDDASTDDTAAIIRELAEKHPDLIKPVLQTENQYSKGVRIWFAFLYPKVKGRYIAVCEGDDFWTDPYKLQKQFDALEAHPELDVCAHATTRLYPDGHEELISYDEESGIISPEQIIAGGGLSLNTCSLMYRTSMLQKKYRFYELKPFDFTFKVMGALQGGILYLPDNMATYRFQSGPDAWTTRMRKSNEDKIAFYNERIQILKYLNEDTDYRFDSTIQKTIQANQWELAWFNADFRTLVRPEYAAYLKKKPFQKRLLIRFGSVCPKLALKIRIVLYHARLRKYDRIIKKGRSEN